MLEKPKETNQASYLKRLFVARLLASLALLVVFYWFGKSFGQQNTNLLVKLIGVWSAFAIIQIFIFRFNQNSTLNLLFQLLSDLVFIGFIIYGSGGLTSPFIFLLGLVIITAGTQARASIVLFIAVLASLTYLIDAYIYANIYHQPIQTEHVLHLLLQTSLFFLAGGIIALMARRHTNLQQQEKQVSSKHRQLQEIHSQVLASMQEGIVTLNDNFTIEDFNSTASKLLGFLPQHIGYKLDSFIKVSDTMANITHAQDFNIFRWEIYHNSQYLLLTLTKLHEGTSSWLLTVVDITEIRQLEHQLAEQDKLASIGQMAAMLAHEIRNPMQTISQAVELMGLQQKDSKLEHIVTNEISRLNRLVSDMLDYASPLHPTNQYIQIKPLIQTAIEQVDLRLQHAIQIKVPKTHVNIDPDHLRLVLDNLLRNALRVSPEPASIQILFDVTDGGWTLTVCDHGPGISPIMRKTLFQPFQTGYKQGTGLGLATVWQVCQANQWQIKVDDNSQGGACFIVENNIASNPITHGENHG